MQSGMLTLDDSVKTWDVFFSRLNRWLKDFSPADPAPILSEPACIEIQQRLYFYLASTGLRGSMRPQITEWAKLLRAAVQYGIDHFDTKEKHGLYSNLLVRNGIQPECLGRLVRDLETFIPPRDGRLTDRFRWQLMHRLDAIATEILPIKAQRIKFLIRVFEALPPDLSRLPFRNDEISERISAGAERWDWWEQGVSDWTIREEANRLMEEDGLPMQGTGTPAFYFIPRHGF